MHVERVTLTRVFGVQRRSARRRHTAFGFASARLTRYSATVEGWPEISEGSDLSFVLARRDDWDRILGWFNHTSSEKVTPDTSAAALGSAVFFSALIFFGWVFLHHGWHLPLLFPIAVSACGCLYWLHRAIQFHKAGSLIHWISKGGRPPGGRCSTPVDTHAGDLPAEFVLPLNQARSIAEHFI